MRKGDIELNDFVIRRIHYLVKTDINFCDERIPQAIYNLCRTLLPLTRTSSACDCLICRIGKLKLNKKNPLGPKEQTKYLEEGECSKD